MTLHLIVRGLIKGCWGSFVYIFDVRKKQGIYGLLLCPIITGSCSCWCISDVLSAIDDSLISFRST